MPTKISITGGPGTGKTSTLNLLGEEHTIVREVARDLIDTQIKVEGGILPWTEFMTFQHMVHAVQKQRERGLTPGYVFLDRSHIDQLCVHIPLCNCPIQVFLTLCTSDFRSRSSFLDKLYILIIFFIIFSSSIMRCL